MSFVSLPFFLPSDRGSKVWGDGSIRCGILMDAMLRSDGCLRGWQDWRILGSTDGSIGATVVICRQFTLFGVSIGGYLVATEALLDYAMLPILPA
jgi:hypothetical protein